MVILDKFLFQIIFFGIFILLNILIQKSDDGLDIPLVVRVPLLIFISLVLSYFVFMFIFFISLFSFIEIVKFVLYIIGCFFITFIISRNF